MKCVMKVLLFLGGILLLLTLAQKAIDYLYNGCEKRYISTENLED